MLSRLLTVSFLFTTTSSLQAQHQQGTIFYERKVDMHRHIDDEQMKAMIPQFQTGEYQLSYRDSVCFYNAVPKDEAPDPFEGQGGGTHIVMHISAPGDGGTLYRNFSSAQLLEQTTLADVQYVITDSIHSLPWKLSADTLTLLGHLCKKATAVSPPNNTAIVAWYCEDFPVPVGPERFGGLPGAILKLDMDNGAFVYTATRLSPTADTKTMKMPNGKLITRAAFDKKLDDTYGPADNQGRRIIRN